MARTLLQLVHDACDEIGITRPQSLIGNTDDTSRQILRLANREGKDFHAIAHSKGGWTMLHKDYTFTTVAATASYALPSDFQYFASRTFWDGSMRWRLVGPLLAQKENLLRYGIEGVGPRTSFYMQGGRLVLYPTPTSGFTVAYDYYSNAWCKSAADVDQSSWQDDTDTYKLDEECFVLGLKWRWLRSKKLDYADEFREYMMECERVISRDGSSMDLPLNKGTFTDASYGVTSSSESDFDGVISDGGFSDGFSDGFG